MKNLILFLLILSCGSFHFENEFVKIQDRPCSIEVSRKFTPVGDLATPLLRPFFNHKIIFKNLDIQIDVDERAPKYKLKSLPRVNFHFLKLILHSVLYYPPPS